MLKAIAAVLKHDLGLPGGMLAEDAALKYFYICHSPSRNPFHVCD